MDPIIQEETQVDLDVQMQSQDPSTEDVEMNNQDQHTIVGKISQVYTKWLSYAIHAKTQIMMWFRKGKKL